jgi:hypothetical protein
MNPVRFMETSTPTRSRCHRHEDPSPTTASTLDVTTPAATATLPQSITDRCPPGEREQGRGARPYLDSMP